jgi:phosphomannomutase
MSRNIFRAYDVRGIYNRDLTPEMMFKIGLALGTKHHGKTFTVGGDVRSSSEVLAFSLMSGLMATGGSVAYAGITSFGQTLFAGLRTKRDITAYVTASHLPPEWNGLKLFYGDGDAFSEEEYVELADIVFSEKFQRAEWKDLKPLELIDYNMRYVNHLKRRFNITKPLKVVLDCGGGSTALSAPALFKALGLNVVELSCEADPTFSARPSEVNEENIAALKKKVLGEHADMGVAFDGDGDRAALVDDRGRVLMGNQTGIILGRQILGHRKGKIIGTVSCTMAMETILGPLGGEVVRVPVGHSFVTRNTKRQKAVLGMEESSHFVLPQYFFFDDAVPVPLKIMEMMCESGKRLSELADEVPHYPFVEIPYDCADDKKFGVIGKLRNELQKQYPKVNALDGIRVEFDDAWALIRASNTSPIIRLYVEALSEARLNELKAKFSRILEEALK